MLKKILILILVILLIILGVVSYKNIYLKYFIVFENTKVTKDLNREESKVLISKKSEFIGDINLKSGEIIIEDNSTFSGSIYLNKGKIKIGDNVIFNGNINFSGEIKIGKNTQINGNISKNSDLSIYTNTKISGEKPNLYKTLGYPEFLQYFGSLPDSHKREFGYIYVTSHNMDIRGKDLSPEKYFKNIYFYENGELKEFDFSDKQKLKQFYDNAKYYINLLPERKVSRFGVGFVTKNYSFDRKKPDMYLSEYAANYILFNHEYGHVMDYAFGFIDTHNPKYPYYNKENSITEYGKFHVGEDFAEAYRYYILHKDNFLSMAENNSEIEEKYNYLKTYVFSGKEF